MRRAAVLFLAALGAAAPAAARAPSKSCLVFGPGVDLLTGDTSGDVVSRRASGGAEIGIGRQFGDRFLLEFTYGFLGRHEQDPPIGVVPELTPYPPDVERAWRVALNPLFLRLRYAPGGQRSEYLKPEFGVGLGCMQVSRLLRNYPGVPSEDTSQLLPSLEFGAAALVVFSRNFMMTLGGRYRLTTRAGIADGLDHLDSVAFTLGFRTFLPSPRDLAEP